MIHLVAAIAILAAGTLGTLLVRALDRRQGQFWPPPREGGWEDWTFWGLFRVYCGAVVVAAPVDPVSTGWEHWSRLAVGLPLLVAGSAATLHGYSFLGLDNTYGKRAGLVTDGVYAYSRNPQYIASTAAAVGWALTFDSAVTVALAGGLFAIYTLSALNEEAWLEARYGEPYRDYMRRVPRFLGWRSARRALAALR